MEEQDQSFMQTLLEELSKLPRQRKDSSRNEHIMRMQPPLTSVQEYEELLARWNRGVLLEVVSSFVRDDPEAAEDIVQHALLRGYLNLKSGGPYAVPRGMLKHLKTVDSASQNLDLDQREVKVDNPSAWMYTILRNTARNYANNKKKARERLTVIVSQLEREAPRFERPEITAERNAENEELHSYVAALPQPYSHIIKQHFFEGRKLKDIADELVCPYSTVRVYATRGLQMLKEILKGEREVKDGQMTKKRRVS